MHFRVQVVIPGQSLHKVQGRNAETTAWTIFVFFFSIDLQTFHKLRVFYVNYIQRQSFYSIWAEVKSRDVRKCLYVYLQLSSYNNYHIVLA